MGEWLALGAALCFSVANVAVMRGARRGGDDNGAFLSLLLTVGLSGAGWLLADPRDTEITPSGLAWLAAAGVFTAFVGRVFLYASIQRLGAMRAAAVKRLNPVFAVLLGLVVLGESLSGDMAWGAALIVTSFAVLVRAQWRAGPGDDPAAAGASGPAARAGYLYGSMSALGYALGYLLRKAGLQETPDPFFGALIGSAVGVLMFVAAAALRPSYRRAVAATFGPPNGWLWGAGIMSSAGQILTFAALAASPMSRVALVISMEVFVTIGLSVLFFGERLTPRVAAAALLGFAGTAWLV